MYLFTFKHFVICGESNVKQFSKTSASHTFLNKADVQIFTLAESM